MDGYYPDDMQPEWVCVAEGHDGNTPHCSRCGFINYAWLGYLGAVARWAKGWGVTRKNAERRMQDNADERDAWNAPEGAVFVDKEDES